MQRVMQARAGGGVGVAGLPPAGSAGRRAARGSRVPLPPFPHAPLLQGRPSGPVQPAGGCGGAPRSRAGISPLAVRSTRDKAWDGRDVSTMGMWDAGVKEGPSCICIKGTLGTASMVELEALYLQARNAYYEGDSLLADDDFDLLEIQLKKLKSNLVKKWPRCSLRKKQVYADAELDSNQASSLKVIWVAFFVGSVWLIWGATVPGLAALWAVATGGGVEAAPTGGMAEAMHDMMGKAAALAALPVAFVSGGQLAKGEVEEGAVAITGTCPACLNEVYAFLELDDKGAPIRKKQDCHVCDRGLVFHALRDGTSDLWAYGRVYLVKRPGDYEPPRA